MVMQSVPKLVIVAGVGDKHHHRVRPRRPFTFGLGKARVGVALDGFPNLPLDRGCGLFPPNLDQFFVQGHEMQG